VWCLRCGQRHPCYYTLAGLERPNQGKVIVAGHSLYDQPAHDQARVRNRMMGYVFQSYFLLPELTALENVMLPSMIGGRPAEERAKILLERVGLGERNQHLPAELSGGERRRVAIARALINDPEIIFADEPTGNLDSRTGIAVMDSLLAMVSEQKRTLVVVTHDARLAEAATGNSSWPTANWSSDRDVVAVGPRLRIAALP